MNLLDKFFITEINQGSGVREQLFLENSIIIEDSDD